MAIQYVQSNFGLVNNPPGGTSCSAVYNNPQTSGNCNVVIVWTTNSTTITGVTDDDGNTYFPIYNTGAVSGPAWQIGVYLANPISDHVAGNTVRATFSTGPSGVWSEMMLLEYSGVLGTAFDGTSVSSGQAISRSSTITTGLANSVILSICGKILFETTTDVVTPTGYTRRLTSYPSGSMWVAEHLQAVAGSSTATWTGFNAASNWATVMNVALKASTTTPPPPATVELAALRAFPASQLDSCKSFPDGSGLQGTNTTAGPGGIAPTPSVPGTFEADEQRGAMDGLLVGVAALNDAYVASAITAIAKTYTFQIPTGQASAGAFVGASQSAFHMRFWMAWSNHAINVLLSDAHYSTLYLTQIQALFPKIELSMDFLLANGACTLNQANTQLWQDYPSPNRSIIIAEALYEGAYLLTGYSTQGKIDSYKALAQTWLDNCFVANSITTTGLYRISDGDWLEGTTNG